MVKDGRTTSGKPSSAAIACASSREWAMAERALSAPQRATTSLKAWRSSAALIASMEAPMSSTPYSSSTPFSYSARAVLSAVCPPRVGSRASGRSLAMIVATTSGVIGST